MFTRHDCHIRLLVAEVCGTAHGVNAVSMFARRGTDEGSVSWDQFVFVYTLALLCGRSAVWLADGDKTDAIRRAAGVGTAAVTVTLESWRKRRRKGWRVRIEARLFFLFVKVGSHTFEAVIANLLFHFTDKKVNQLINLKFIFRSSLRGFLLHISWGNLLSLFISVSCVSLTSLILIHPNIHSLLPDVHLCMSEFVSVLGRSSPSRKSKILRQSSNTLHTHALTD